MTRFFLSETDFAQNEPLLTGENAAHAKVLRLKIGEQVLICDGQGSEAVCSVAAVDSEAFRLCVLDRGASFSEARISARIYMAFPKGDKLEHVIQKATELGASEIIAFPSARCVSRPDEKSLKKKLERWKKIASGAAEQSGRGKVPAIRVLPSFKDAVEEAVQADVSVLFYENERATTFRMALEGSPYTTVSLLTGPEGGLEPSEVDRASAAGMKICTLGRRILRCETAPLCALSAVMYDSGEF